MRSVQAGRIVHALLFSGAHGTGKKTWAARFAQTMLCTGVNKPCGACPACKQFKAGMHPDVRYLRPEKNIIKVDAIRELIDYLALRPYEGGRHIAIIEQAETMNAGAQNALLKTLESPAEGDMFFLLTENPGNLLPTILSRCQTVRFDTPSVEQCTDILVGKGFDRARARTLAGLAQGSVGRALELDTDADYFALRDKVLNAVERLTNRASVAKAAAEITEIKGSERDALDMIELWARDLMLVKKGLPPFESDDINKLKKSRTDGALLLKETINAKKKLESNVAWIHIIETMFFKLTA